MVYEGLCGKISKKFMTGQTTDRQNRLLNPASRMRVRGNDYSIVFVFGTAVHFAEQ